MDQDEFRSIQQYLEYGTYPDGLQKGEKANLRRKCKTNYKLESGILYYKRTRKCPSDEPWRVCIKTKAEKNENS